MRSHRKKFQSTVWKFTRPGNRDSSKYTISRLVRASRTITQSCRSGTVDSRFHRRQYDVVTYKTAIAAARAGKFEVGPVKAKAQVIVPRRRSAPRSRSPFGFDLDDPFSDPFFSNPFAQMGERREVEIKSEPVALE